MTFSSALWAAVAALAVATAALWTNPRRELNRVLAGAAFVVVLWLGCVHAFSVGNGLAELRLSWMIAELFLPTLWWVRDAILWPGRTAVERVRHVRFAWLFPLCVAAGVFTDWFAVPQFGSGVVYGPGVHVLGGVGILGAIYLAFDTWKVLQNESGARRLDLQLFALWGSPAIGSAFALGMLAVWLRDPGLERLVPLTFIALFGGMVWSLLTSRPLGAKHLLKLGLEKAILVAGVSFFVWGIQQVSAQFFPAWLSYGLSIALGLWFAAEVRPWLQEVSQRKPEAERIRRAASEIARRDLGPEPMEAEFLKLLRAWSDCDRAVILVPSQGRLLGGGVEWAIDRSELKLLHAIRWATPQRLERERARPHSEPLRRLLDEEGLGILVASAGPSLGFVLGLGVPRSHQPYTFPKIGQLLGLETIIEGALSRAHYQAKVQHAEKLATVGLLGASIAHEIRNPLVSIKTFVQLLPQHYQEQAFRDKFFRLIGDEVGRIDRLTEQLLDLSSPRVFSPRVVGVHEILTTCIDLIAAKADDKGIRIEREFTAQNDAAYVDPNAIKQVVLNLGFNAIQALEHHSGERLIRLCTRQGADFLEVTVTDSGPGISPEVWARLFQPFQSTKSSGFGLGLAICKDILSSLHASITADPPTSGCGATFRIILPCLPPTS